MPGRLTLIHLVSEQTMQNLLPLLALRPQRVIQICSNDPRFARIAENLEKAARVAGIHAEFQTETIQKDSPNVAAVRHALKQTLAIFPTAVVNITGGTKLMSVGAYLGAGEFPAASVLYCDTNHKTFVHAGGRALPLDLPKFREISASLTLRTVMAAHGKSPDDWKFDTASDAERGFGQTAWDLRSGHPDDFQRFGGCIRGFFRDKRGKIPSSVEKLRSLVTADLTSALRGELSAPVRDYLDAATRSGFLAALPGGGYRLAEGPAEKRKLRGHVEKTANLLDGSWLELSVLSFICRSSCHRDPHWSVEPSGGTPDAEYGETDIVAVDVGSASLEIISCKTALKQPLEHLEGLRTRANNLGGNHARATLAVLRAGGAAEEERLHRWGRLLKVKVLIGGEIPSYFAP